MVNGQWPPYWYHKFPMITHIQQIEIVPDKSDMVMWKKNDGSVCKFSTKQTYKDLHDSGCRVEWSKLVWFFQNMHLFCG